MFGKLTLEQRKALQTILIQSGMIALNMRTTFLSNAGLGKLLPILPMGEVDNIFAGALVRECERLGTPPDLGEYATVLLAKEVRDTWTGQVEVVQALTDIIAVYVPDHAVKHPVAKKEENKADPRTKILKPPIKVAAFFASPLNAAALPHLNEEELKVRDFLNRQNDFDLITLRQTRLKDLLALLDRRTHRLTIFHYSGHANEEGIWLEPEQGGDPDIVRWDGLAKELSYQPDLACVVLNGCKTATNDFVSNFGAARPVIIAMSEPIGDHKATLFTTRLYEVLAAKDDIQTAFEKACNYLRMKGYGDSAGIPRLL